MNEPHMMLLKSKLKQLRLPTMSAECVALAREASQANEAYEQYLLRLTEAEMTTRAANVLKSMIKRADFPAMKDLDTYDFAAQPSVNKMKVVELAKGAWIDAGFNCCLIGQSGTGKTHLAIALGLSACRRGRKVKFVTAAGLVNRLEEAQKSYQLERFLDQLRRIDLLICDELGYLSFVTVHGIL